MFLLKIGLKAPAILLKLSIQILLDTKGIRQSTAVDENFLDCTQEYHLNIIERKISLIIQHCQIMAFYNYYCYVCGLFRAGLLFKIAL